MTKNEALKLALDALDNLLYWDNGKSDYDQAREAISAIQQVLAAQPAVPLTDEQLLDILRGIDSDAVRLPPGFKAFARAIEAAHGITKGQP